jgi:hypothetical protein
MPSHCRHTPDKWRRSIVLHRRLPAAADKSSIPGDGRLRAGRKRSRRESDGKHSDEFPDTSGPDRRGVRNMVCADVDARNPGTVESLRKESLGTNDRMHIAFPDLRPQPSPNSARHQGGTQSRRIRGRTRH